MIKYDEEIFILFYPTPVNVWENARACPKINGQKKLTLPLRHVTIRRMPCNTYK